MTAQHSRTLAAPAPARIACDPRIISIRFDGVQPAERFMAGG
jgi:hypothetical protein